MRHRSKTNSRKHENQQLFNHYRDQNPVCELSRWFKRNCRGGMTDAELNDQSSQVHHIHCGCRKRHDLWSNLITVSASIHRWIHDLYPFDGTVVALFRKYEKNELNFQEWRHVSGKRMEGYLLSREPQFAAIIPLHRELLAHTERNEPQ